MVRNFTLKIDKWIQTPIPCIYNTPIELNSHDKIQFFYDETIIFFLTLHLIMSLTYTYIFIASLLFHFLTFHYLSFFFLIFFFCVHTLTLQLNFPHNIFLFNSYVASRNKKSNTNHFSPSSSTIVNF
jgi:hypothetical protein